MRLGKAAREEAAIRYFLNFFFSDPRREQPQNVTHFLSFAGGGVWSLNPMHQNEKLHPIGAVALSEAIPTKQIKQLREQIAEGTNVGFELTAKLSGRLTRSEPTDAAPTASILNEAIIAETIRRLGVTREAFEAKLLDVAAEALIDGVPIRDRLIEQSPELLSVIHTIKQNVVARLPRQTRAGMIKVAAGVEITRLKIT